MNSLTIKRFLITAYNPRKHLPRNLNIEKDLN